MIGESRRVYKGFVTPTASPDAAPITAAHKSNTSLILTGLLTRQIACPHRGVINWRNIVRPMPQNRLIFIKLCSRTRWASSAPEGNLYVRDEA
jgi:hypothetical protein